MPQFEIHIYKIVPETVRVIEAESSKVAVKQFAAEVNRTIAAGQVTEANEIGRFLVELFEEGGRKMGSVSIPQSNCNPPHDIRPSS